MEERYNANENLYALESKKNKSNLKCETNVDYLEVIDSEDIYLKVLQKDCEIRRDIDVTVRLYNRIYGTVYNECKKPVENVVVNLIKYENYCGNLEREIIDYSVTDEMGGYSFLVDSKDDISRYKIEINCII